MNSPHEFKKQFSFFLREKFKTARLALTDVTPAQLLAEEVITGDLSALNMQTMRIISCAAFEVDDYWRIVDILHKRLSKFYRRNWQPSYNALMLLEYLLTHGPPSTAKEFQSDEDFIRQMGSFQYVDEKGFNWGPSIRNMSERVIKLLEDGSFLKEERERATFEIRGFGSFCERPVSGEESMKEAFSERYLRRNSHFTDCKQKLESTHIGVIHKNVSYKKMEIDIDDPNIGDAMEWDQHPFGDITDNHNGASLLSTSGLSSKGLRYRGGRKKNVVE